MLASSKQLSCSDYHVAWICPVADVELLPARLMLDEEHPAPPYNTHYDDNTYICGSIGGHTVVVATCPQGESGNVNAGRLTGSMFRTFPNIRMAVLVGIGGGIPSLEVSEDPVENVHLGDVVVGWPGDGKPACVYYDRGRSKGDGHFELVGTVGNPEWRLTNALGILVSDNEMGKTTFDDQLARLQRSTKKKWFAHPGLEHDRLFKATYRHVGDYKSRCAGCDAANLVQRPQRTEVDKDALIFHRGRVATGNAVIQDGKLRDEIGARCDGALCVEMEAAGVNVNRQCLVIRGISDYADSHKSDLWRSYAAGRAAAFTRELLGRVQPAAVCEMEAIRRGVLLAPQGQAGGVSRRSISPQHAFLGQAMLGLDIVQKAKSHSSPKISIKTFQKLYPKEGTLLGDAAGRLVSEFASILKSVSVQQNCISSVQFHGGVEVLEGFSNICPQDLKRLRNIIKSSQNVCVNYDGESHLLLFIR
jgi:nucleoside phosphorylase